MHFSVVSSFGCSLSVCLRVLVVVVCVCVDAPFFCLELCVRKQDLDTGFPGYWIRVFHMCICVRVRKANVHWRFSPPEDSQFNNFYILLWV